MANKPILIRLDLRIVERLTKYISATYGSHYGLSLTVERAVREFLDREEMKEK